MAEIRNPVLANGTQYAWGNIIIKILGQNLVGVTKIDYKDSQVMEMVYGAGTFAVGRGFGRYSAEGTITLLKEEMVGLQKVFTRIQDIPDFDIQVTYAVSPTKVVTDVLRKCRFKNNGSSVSEGDTSISVDVELSVAKIDWGVPAF
jgi:hypothetical protein